jgi:hypothetical protein
VCIEGKDKKRNSSYAVCNRRRIYRRALRLALVCVVHFLQHAAFLSSRCRQMGVCVTSTRLTASGGPTDVRTDRGNVCRPARLRRRNGRITLQGQMTCEIAPARAARTHLLHHFLLTRRVPTQTMKVVKMARAEAARSRANSIKHASRFD